MARRSGFPSPSRRSSGVARDWGAGPGGSVRTTISSTTSVVLGSGVQTLGSELTLLRMRGIADFSFVGPPTSDGDGFFGAIGVGVFTDQAFTAGVASLPTPLTEAFSNVWLWHSYFSIHVADITLGFSPASAQRIMVDSKAMRKFDSNQVIAAIVETVEIGTASLGVHFDSRILFQDSGR